MRKRKIIQVLIGLLLVVALVLTPMACKAPEAPPVAPPVEAPPEEVAPPVAPPEEVKVVKIGYVGPKTGPLAYLGIPMHQGAQIAVDMCNEAGGLNLGGQKYRVELLHFDCHGETESAVSGATQFVEQGCTAVVTCFGTQVPLQTVTEPAKVILVTCGGADEVIRSGIDYTFAFEGPSNTIEPWGKFYTTVLNVKKMAVLTENQEFSVDRTRIFIPEWKKRGTEITYEGMFEPDTTDFYTILSKIKATDPDALFLSAYSMNALALFEQRLEMNYPIQVFTFNQLTCIGPEAWRLVGEAGNGLIEEIWHYPMGMEPEPWAIDLMGFDPDLRAAFMEEVAERHGGENLSANHGLAHDMVFEFLETLKQAGSLDPDAIVAAYETETVKRGVLFECFHWKDSHRILVPRGLGRYYNVDPVTGAVDLDFIRIAKFLDAFGQESEIHDISEFDVQEYRAEMGY